MVPARSHKPNDAGSIPAPATDCFTKGYIRTLVEYIYIRCGINKKFEIKHLLKDGSISASKNISILFTKAKK